MLFKLSNLNSNAALTLGYLNPALNNSALMFTYVLIRTGKSCGSGHTRSSKFQCHTHIF